MLSNKSSNLLRILIRIQGAVWGEDTIEENSHQEWNQTEAKEKDPGYCPLNPFWSFNRDPGSLECLWNKSPHHWVGPVFHPQRHIYHKHRAWVFFFGTNQTNRGQRWCVTSGRKSSWTAGAHRGRRLDELGGLQEFQFSVGVFPEFFLAVSW